MSRTTSWSASRKSHKRQECPAELQFRRTFFINQSAALLCAVHVFVRAVQSRERRAAEIGGTVTDAALAELVVVARKNRVEKDAEEGRRSKAAQ